MTNDPTQSVIDADGHVLEPADTWLKYLDPSFRDRAIRIARDEQGYEVLLIDGQPLKTIRELWEGCVGISRSPARAARGGRHLDEPVFARCWETVQELEMPIVFLVVVRDRQCLRQLERRDPSDGLFSIVFLAIDGMAAF